MAVAFVVATVSYVADRAADPPPRPARRRPAGSGGSACGCTRRRSPRRSPHSWSLSGWSATVDGHRRAMPLAGWTPMTVPAHGEPVPTTTVIAARLRPARHPRRPSAAPHGRRRLGRPGRSATRGRPSRAEPSRQRCRPAHRGRPRVHDHAGRRDRRRRRVADGAVPRLAARRGSTTAFEFQPDVMLAMWGAWEVYDHRVGDEVLVAGTPEYGARLRAGAWRRASTCVTAVAPDDAARVRDGARACTRPGWRSEAQSSPRNDPERLAWINERTARRGGRATPGASWSSTSARCCAPAGEPIDRGRRRRTAREDGVHFTPEFSPTVWAYIESAGPALARRPGTGRQRLSDRRTWGGHRAWR